MAEIRTATTLRRKAEEIRKTIVGHEQRLQQARADLSHIAAAIAIFEASGDPADMQRYVDIHRIWPRGELVRLCKGFLEAEGPLTTKALAERAMKASGLDAGDNVLASSVAFRIVQAMRQQHKRGKIEDAGRVKGNRIWAVRQPPLL